MLAIAPCLVQVYRMMSSDFSDLYENSVCGLPPAGVPLAPRSNQSLDGWGDRSQSL